MSADIPENAKCEIRQLGRQLGGRIGYFACHREAKGRLPNGKLACGPHLAGARRSAANQDRERQRDHEKQEQQEAGEARVKALARFGVTSTAHYYSHPTSFRLSGYTGGILLTAEAADALIIRLQDDEKLAREYGR